MSPLKRSNNVAARMGRWSAAHWKTAVFGWLAFIAAALVLGQVVRTRQIDPQNANVGQSHRADRLLRDAGFRPDPQTEIVLVQSTRVTADAPAFRAAVADVLRTVRPFETIANLRSPYTSGAGQISTDGHSAMIEWTMKDDSKTATKHIGAITAATAAAAARRSVLISGVTVMVAMAGMLLSGDKMYLSFGVATMIVVAVAMLGSLTVLPALLSKLGDRVEKGRIPFVGRLRRDRGENRRWSAALTPALRKPIVSAIAATAILLVLAAPVLGIHTAESGLDSLPKGIPTVATIDRLQHAFPGNVVPAVVAIKANTDSPATVSAIRELRRLALATGEMRNPIDVEVNPAHSVARVTIPLVGSGTDARSTHALRTLRDRILPATVGTVPGAACAVTGGTANSVDANALLKRSWPLVFAFVLTIAFVVLLVSFRSIVIAVKAIVLNLLSVGSAYGVLVAVFQYSSGGSGLRL